MDANTALTTFTSMLVAAVGKESKAMIFTTDIPLIASAPGDAMLIVGSIFGISAAVLFALAVEAGTYPRTRAAITNLAQRIRRIHPGDLSHGTGGHKPSMSG